MWIMTISLYCHNFDKIKRWQTAPQTCVSETKASVAENSFGMWGKIVQNGGG